MELVHDVQWYVQPWMPWLVFIGGGVATMIAGALGRSSVPSPAPDFGGLLFATPFAFVMIAGIVLVSPNLSMDDPNSLFSKMDAAGGWGKHVRTQLESGYGVEVIKLGDGNIPGGDGTFVTWMRDDAREVCDIRPESGMDSEGKQIVNVFCGDLLVEPK